ncbi:hypothetical protein BELL_0094g00160 [Botrytis elliptica]|uniref:Uncharacterized protein n=1 Tax=Botrytis elliptica TaxID=278938 RepID=A0A4Z1JWZ9_9HELO|nr:hypothetical protein EAE99_003708 [Botrytis elliptica]TGO77714.1 hypothetical protein BELL_0094g00160 [Botrytis elliptica]
MNEPIAIIGSGCRLAGGCQSPSELWNLLHTPYDVSQEFPPDRASASRHDSLPRGYFLSQDVREFDASFFSLSPLEAQAMDPQHRLLLETVYEALEEAGLPAETLRGSDTAVYTGVMFHDYLSLSSQDHMAIPKYHITGTAPNKASNRISYFFDWHGPSVTVDTACSSSLVALDHAVQQLRSGSSTLAVAAGANLLLDGRPFIGFNNMGMLSPTGSCKMWDTNADGYARGEGILAMLLKPLRLALADGDNIQCVIRETGVNHNGRTSGITLPSASAQTSLIRDVYHRAGLDPTKPSDRPQYIEAHGTGTQAGDPLEAEALAMAFSLTSSQPDEARMLVGSIKTVIGHTEGAAGLAGVLKASLAIQHGVIPPNLGFQQLNDKVAPFCTNMNVATSAQPWPTTASNTPRRVSINSFGFGGTNAHVILESAPLPTENGCQEASLLPINGSSLPYVFSAASEQSLISMLKQYEKYLRENPSIDSTELISTLASRRSLLPVRARFPVSSISSLQQAIKSSLESELIGYQSPLKESKILGIFTGQGAQWAQMGIGLLAEHPSLIVFLDDLDTALQSLPEGDRPTWSLREELKRPSEESRINTPEICQPACTAIQLMLGHLLQEFYGVSFSAVVGHSSGEIAAAYFAGFLRSADAIRIAFYRGLHVARFISSFNQEGRMLAAGLSQDEAEELLAATEFLGRLSLAAVNSPSSVSLSGDADAIEEAQAQLANRKIFNRILNVETAYHSHHMSKCSSAYQASLEKCQVEVLRPSNDAPCWYSSVQSGEPISSVGSEKLGASYWVDNLVNPVMFHHAIQNAVSLQPDINFCLEVGPHPALKGPTIQTITTVRKNPPPYSSTLNRAKTDLVAFSECVGDLWVHLGSARVPRFDALKHTKLSLVGLPTYPWDHRHSFWLPPPSINSTKGIWNQQTSQKRVNSLLGYRVGDGDIGSTYRWSNDLRIDQLGWLSGHTLEGQIIFPATGYIALALEACRQFAAGQSIQSITLKDVKFLKALRIDETSGANITVTMNVSQNEDSVIQAKLSVDIPPTEDDGKFSTAATMDIMLEMGSPVDDLLPGRAPFSSTMTELDHIKVYDHLAKLGYEYTEMFQRVRGLRRSLGQSVADIDWDHTGDNEYVLHPALLDNAVQVLFSAFTDHHDESMWNLYMPVSVDQVTLDFSLSCLGREGSFSVDSYLRKADNSGICGDVTLFNFSGQGIIQMEGLDTMPVSPATENNDLVLFSETVWGVAEPNGELALGTRRASPETLTKTLEWERVSLYYLRTIGHKFIDQKTGKRIQTIEIEPHHGAFLDYCSWLEETVRLGKHPYASPSWLSDTEKEIEQICRQYSAEDIDFRLIKMAFEVLPPVIRKDTTMLQSFMADDALSDWYQNSMVCAPAEEPLGEIISQISHRHRGLNVLEIGAGTGCATRSVLPALGSSLARYTFTDVSVGFFEKSAQQFSTYADFMDFKTFDLDQDPMDQGFIEGSYDLIVAYAVLHVASSLSDALRRVRRLLKPGGFLVLAEVLGDGPMALGLIFGGFTGWWAGREEGRRYSPTVSLEAWQEVLANTGFSGVDTHTPLKDPITWPISVMVSQAVDDRVQLLREPLLSSEPVLEDLIIVTDLDFPSHDTMQLLKKLLAPHASRITHFNSLAEIDGMPLPDKATVLNLAHLEIQPSEKAWRGLQNLLGTALNILWVTDNYLSGNASSGLSTGLARSLLHEMPHLRLQMIDLNHEAKPNTVVSLIANNLLRLAKGRDNDELWTTEPEMVIDAMSRVLVPRLQPLRTANNRLNSWRRKITAPVHMDEDETELKWQNDNFMLVAKGPLRSYQGSSRVIRTTRSALAAIPPHNLPVYLNQGVDSLSGEVIVAVSDTLSSILTVPMSLSIPVDLETSNHPQYLDLLATDLLIKSIVDRITPGNRVLLYAGDSVAAAYEKFWSYHLHAKQFQVHYVTGTKELATTALWQYCNPQAPKRLITSTLPKGIDTFINLSKKDAAAKVLDCLPLHCQQFTFPSAITATSSISSLQPIQDMTELLTSAHAAVQKYIELDFTVQLPEYSIAELLNHKPRDFSSVPIVNWSCGTPLLADYQSVDTSQHILRPDRTYWLVGLTGDLGQSLCDWMVLHGARTIVLTSRQVRMPTDWVHRHRDDGVNIVPLAGDVTNAASLKEVHTIITNDHPPLDGIASGAMVMRENFFQKTTAEEFSQVVEPKVRGLQNLDDLVGDQPLLFFIAFSSVLATLGNLGQSAYTAANVASEALIVRRQQRKLAGSVIQISRMTDVGYVKRQRSTYSAQEMERLDAYCLPMGERQLHALFAEGILAGRLPRNSMPVITAGIPRITTDKADNAAWMKNIRFSRYWEQKPLHQDDRVEKKTGNASIRIQLSESKSTDEAEVIVRDGVTTKIRACLHLPSDQPVAEHAALIDLGVDSLVAVDIRAWTMTELGVDIPVLRLLSGMTVDEIVGNVLEVIQTS